MLLCGWWLYIQSQYLELYFLWTQLTSALFTHWLTLQAVPRPNHLTRYIPSSVPIKPSHRKLCKQGNATNLTCCGIITYLFTYSMEQSPSWGAYRFSASWEIPAFYGIRRFITAFTSARYLSLIWQLDQKNTVQVWGSLYEGFVTSYVLTVRSC